MATPAPELPRLAILASGRGSNAEVLMDAARDGLIPARMSLVFSNVPSAPVLDKARARRIPTAAVASKGLPRDEHERQVLKALADARIDHVLLAGYMRVLGPVFLRGFAGTVLNIHPALLPDFPGLDAGRRQWEAGAKIAGATVHLVSADDAGVDTGQVILMGSLVVRGDEGAEGLERRLLEEVEHVIYPRAVRLHLDRIARRTSP